MARRGELLLRRRHAARGPYEVVLPPAHRAGRRERRGGLLEHLLAAQEGGVTLDGAPIRDRDIIASLWGMYSAGTDTTGNSFASIILMPADDPALLQAMRAGPDLIAPMVEEGLRLDPAFPRVTHEPLSRSASASWSFPPARGSIVGLAPPTATRRCSTTRRR